ncbi:MAG: YdeI/OmpD-associated family protein [Leucobacter sp.]
MAGKTAVREAIAFEGVLQRVGDRMILRFPDEASAALPSRGQVAVRAALNGHPFETVVEPDGRRGHWLSIDEDLLRAASGASGAAPVAGDTATLEVEPMKEWPEPEVPHDLAAALGGALDPDGVPESDGVPDLAEVWASLTPMARWEWVRWVDATKNPETRARRVEATVSKLRGGKRRPCCFDLSSCTVPEVSRSGKLIEV